MKGAHDLSHSWLQFLFLLTIQNFSIFGYKEYTQSNFNIDHLVISMCRVISWVVGTGCLLWPVCSLDKILLALSCFILYSKAKLPCYSRNLLTSHFCILIPYGEKYIFFFFGVLESVAGLHRNINSPIPIHFIIRDWNAKVGSQEIPGITGKFGLGVEDEAGQRITEFCQENALVIENTLFQQHKETTLHMDITRWSVPKSDCLYSLQERMEKLCTVSKNKTRSWLWLRSSAPYCKIQA